MKTLFIVVGIILALPGVATSIHLSVICVASLFFRQRPFADSREQVFLIVVPARNEALVIGDTLTSLKAAIQEEDIILVVADRCTDDTAAIARDAGALVLERTEGAVPGRAAAVEDGIAFASNLSWTAVSVIDADSVVNQEFFAAVDTALSDDRPLAQPRSEHIRSPGLLARASEAAFAMQGVALPRGRQVLGIGVRLRGSGMSMMREIAESTAYERKGASEDLFMSLGLILRGFSTEHVDGARLESLSAPSIKAGGQQRIRWEQGRLGAAREFVPKLLKRGTPAAVESAILLLTPPFAVGVFLVILGSVLCLLGGSVPIALVLAVFAVLLGVDVGIALFEARAPLATWLSLVVAPFYILWKVGLQAVAIVRWRQASESYEPTSRE